MSAFETFSVLLTIYLMSLGRISSQEVRPDIYVNSSKLLCFLSSETGNRTSQKAPIYNGVYYPKVHRFDHNGHGSEMSDRKWLTWLQ